MTDLGITTWDMILVATMDVLTWVVFLGLAGMSLFCTIVVLSAIFVAGRKERESDHD